MADSSSRKDIPPEQMFHLYFPDADKIPKVTASSRWGQPQAVLTHYDICNLYEKLCRRLMFPNLKLWSDPTVYRSDDNRNRFTYTNEFLSVSKDDLRPPKLAASIAATSVWQSVFTTLFRNIFDHVPYLDPDAPIIKARGQNMGYGDSKGTGSYGTKTTYKNAASSSPVITSQEEEGGASATPHSVPEDHIFACVSDWRQDTKLKLVMMAPLPASVDTTIEALAVAAAALPAGPARDQAIADLETARQANLAQALARLNDATAALEEATEAYENAQREYGTAAGERVAAEVNKTAADQAAQAGQDSCDTAREELARAHQALAEATTDEEREAAQAAVNEAQETLNECLESLEELLAAQQEATEALQTAQQKYSAAENKLEVATSKSEECLSEKQDAGRALQELSNNPDIIEHPTQAIYIPEHGLYYHPEGYTFERIAGLFTVGSEWSTEKLRRYALLSFYPELEYRFQGSDINHQWQGATSDQESKTLAILERVGTAGWNSKLEIAGGEEFPETDNRPSYVYPVPPPMYTWNYWDHYKLPESWGNAPGVEDLRKVFLPPMPDTILATHLYINQYPPDKTSMEKIRNGLLERAAKERERGNEDRAAALEQQAANMVPSKTRPSIETGGDSYPRATPRTPHASTDGSLVAADLVLPSASSTGGWKSPALLSQFFKSLFDWADRFRYTLFPLDLSAIAYTVSAEESGTFVETSTGHTESQSSDGSSSTRDSQVTQTLSFTVQANGRGTGDQVLPKTEEAGFSVTGPFTMTLPAVRRNVSGLTGQSSDSSTTHTEVTWPSGNTTSSTFTSTDTDTDELTATADIRTSKFRPLTTGIRRVETGRVTMKSTYTRRQNPDDTGSNDRPVAPKQIQRMVASNATDKEDRVALLTPGNMQFMRSCHMLVLVKLIIDIPPDAVTYGAGTRTTNYTSETDNSTEETHRGKASSKIVAFRLLDLGTPDDKTGTFDADFDPATLTEELVLPTISGPGIDSNLASNVTSVIWKGYDHVSHGIQYPYRHYGASSSTITRKYDIAPGEEDVTDPKSANGESSFSELNVTHKKINISVECQWAGLLIDWDFDKRAAITQSPTKAGKVDKDVDDALDTIAKALAMLLEDKRQVSAAKSRLDSLKATWTSEYNAVIKDSEDLAERLTNDANKQTADAKAEEKAAADASAAISDEITYWGTLTHEEQENYQSEHDKKLADLRAAKSKHETKAANLRSGAACRESHANALRSIALALEQAKVNKIQHLYTPVVDTADEIQSDIDEMLPTLQEKQSRLEKLKNEELPTLQAQITRAAEAIERYTEQVGSAKDDVARYGGEVATADNDLGIAIANRNLAEQRLRDAESLPPDDEGRAEAIQEAQQALQDAEQAKQVATETLQEATDNLAQANTRLVDATSALEEAKATEAELMAELQEKSDELDRLWDADDRAAVYDIDNRVKTLDIEVDNYNVQCEAPHFTNAASFAQHQQDSKNCWTEKTSG